MCHTRCRRIANIIRNLRNFRGNRATAKLACRECRQPTNERTRTTPTPRHQTYPIETAYMYISFSIPSLLNLLGAQLLNSN